jgi:hypothetical protein
MYSVPLRAAEGVAAIPAEDCILAVNRSPKPAEYKVIVTHRQGCRRNPQAGKLEFHKDKAQQQKT